MRIKKYTVIVSKALCFAIMGAHASMANRSKIHFLRVYIAEVKKLYGDCCLMDSGTDAEVIESVKYALETGIPGSGYIFSTSNCLYTGMRLERY